MDINNMKMKSMIAKIKNMKMTDMTMGIRKAGMGIKAMAARIKDVDMNKCAVDAKETPPCGFKNDMEGMSLPRDEMDDDTLDRSAVTSPYPEVSLAARSCTSLI